MKKILLAVFCAVLLIGIGSSLTASSLGTFQINNSVELYQNCQNCSFVNISSVKLPNSTILLFNQNMVKTAQDYTFLFNTTNLLGEYFYTVCGDLDGILSCEDIQFFITKTGFEETTSNSILHFIMIIFVAFIFAFTLWGALRLPFVNVREGVNGVVSINKLKYFKIMLFFLSYVLFVWLLNLLFAISNNFNVLSQYNKLFEVLFRIMMAMSYPLFVLMLVIFFIVAVRDSKIKKLIEEGFNVQ